MGPVPFRPWSIKSDPVGCCYPIFGRMASSMDNGADAGLIPDESSVDSGNGDDNYADGDQF